MRDRYGNLTTSTAVATSSSGQLIRGSTTPRARFRVRGPRVVRFRVTARSLPRSIPEECIVIILGIILLVLGYVLGVSILVTVGIILLVIGAVLWILGAVGRPVGGRKVWF